MNPMSNEMNDEIRMFAVLEMIGAISKCQRFSAPVPLNYDPINLHRLRCAREIKAHVLPATAGSVNGSDSRQ